MLNCSIHSVLFGAIGRKFSNKSDAPPSPPPTPFSKLLGVKT